MDPDQLWQELLPHLLRELEREDARYRPTTEEVIKRMRLNGLDA